MRDISAARFSSTPGAPASADRGRLALSVTHDGRQFRRYLITAAAIFLLCPPRDLSARFPLHGDKARAKRFSCENGISEVD
ncbi:hypothetical protein EVAR_61784_1 [Eumeta japonica]|uniref:Uncharacterized protein n=1 Tax=Eumeta variegata TaxID=151549 RepID=A0A4C1YYI5_EUMVA|nr:hypothetical protein EVAR_61784_1 [Eumeta japonica]